MIPRTLKEIAAANDMTLEEYIKHSSKKKAPPANEAERKRKAAERERQAVERKRHMAAISWEAQRRGSSYGKLVTTLSPEGKARIYREYEEYQMAQEAEMDRQARSIGDKTKRTGPQRLVITERRFDASLTNSTENTDLTETFQP